MGARTSPTISRSIGRFLGHIVKAVKSKPETEPAHRRVQHEEEDRSNVVLRRTVIEEIELKDEQCQ